MIRITEGFSDVKPSNVNKKRLSRMIAIEFDENDDIEEKKAQNKRKSFMLELGLTSNAKNKSTEYSKSSTLTADQITNHYGDCMKLSSENKITSKNAFDLHLIDYLQDHLKRLQSFQVLSSSLDAGAKIYAGRVDLVHNNTYSIFTTCEASPEEIKDEENPINVDEDDNKINVEIKTKRQKKRTDTNKKVTCINIRKIRLTATQIRSEVDPLFQTQTKMYDEGGMGELRLNNLKLLDINYELLLDFESVVSNKSFDINEVSGSDIKFDMTIFSDLFQELSQKQIPISSEFDNFKFTGWDYKNDNTTSQVAELLKNMMLKEESIMDRNDDYDCGGDDDYCGGGGDDFTEEALLEDPDKDVHVKDPEEENKAEEIEDNMLTIGKNKSENESSLFVSNVKEMVNSFMDNYGEINDNVLGMWAGPDHWKQKSKPIKLDNKDIENIPKIDKPKKTKKELIMMFADKVETRFNSDGIGRLMNITKIEDEEPNGVKTSKQLTDECINKNMKKEYLLPTRFQFVQRSINQLMNRDISLVNKDIKKQAGQMANAQLEKNQSPGVDTENENGVFEVVPEDMIVIDADGNIPEDEYYGGGGGGGDDYCSDDDPYTGKSFRNCDFDDFNDNIPVRTLESQDINYAKTAKKINVKKLKHDIQMYLTEKINIKDIATIAKVASSLEKSVNFCHLSDLLRYVDKKSSPEVSKELSVSILMTCLLHLVNELGLDIVNEVDYTDFNLGQGFSEYDIEQVRLFGQACGDSNRAGGQDCNQYCDNSDSE